jgi:hypothetical protein
MLCVIYLCLSWQDIRPHIRVNLIFSPWTLSFIHKQYHQYSTNWVEWPFVIIRSVFGRVCWCKSVNLLLLEACLYFLSSQLLIRIFSQNRITHATVCRCSSWHAGRAEEMSLALTQLQNRLFVYCKFFLTEIIKPTFLLQTFSHTNPVLLMSCSNNANL